MLQRAFDELPYAEIVLRRRSSALELVALARAAAAPDNDERLALLNALEL
jgi:hypothetical protein